ncbi:MAG: DUF5674 family protein [Candidatus Magasanikbacteria bacterium]|nr:DUF5674 family protein [Candidatus Magasanikbacteria bacterium]
MDTSDEGNSVRLLREPITRVELRTTAQERFGDMVKAVVDIEQGIMAIGGEMHADEEQALIANGSLQSALWGINLYVDAVDDAFIEFDSMINIRPRQGNRSRSVEDLSVQQKIRAIVSALIFP